MVAGSRLIRSNVFVSKIVYSLLCTDSSQEDRKMSRHDSKLLECKAPIQTSNIIDLKTFLKGNVVNLKIDKVWTYLTIQSVAKIFCSRQWE